MTGLEGTPTDKDELLEHENQPGEVDFTSQHLLKGPIVKIATGRSHILALDTNGNVFAWGSNQKGQLGQGKADCQSLAKPCEVKQQIGNKQICQIYAGEYHSFAVTKEGEIFAWGNNQHSQLHFDKPSGSKATEYTYVPTQIDTTNILRNIKSRDKAFTRFDENTQIMIN
jgi:alpha-tubulin suppressor-like RCC1 family protein